MQRSVATATLVASCSTSLNSNSGSQNEFKNPFRIVLRTSQFEEQCSAPCYTNAKMKFAAQRMAIQTAHWVVWYDSYPLNVIMINNFN